MYTRTKRCYNERGSRNNYFCFSISRCINYINTEANNIFKTKTRNFLKIHILQHGQQISIFVFICRECNLILMYGTNNVKHAHVFDNEVKLPHPQRHW